MTTVFIKTKDTFAGNNENRVWPISYPYLAVQELRVSVTNPKGISAYITKNLRFDTENACIVYPTLESDLQPLGDGWKICIERQAPFIRDMEQAHEKANACEIAEDLTPIEQLGRIEEARALKQLKKTVEQERCF